MLYTSRDRVKEELHIKSGSSVDDNLLDLLVEAASRAWDRKCTGVVDGDNYFESGSVVGEVLEGQIDYSGQKIICYPHKPIITSVSSFSYQSSIIGETYTVSGSRIDCRGPKVVAYPTNFPDDYPAKCRVTISYVGGLGTSGSALPADMQEAVAILTARFYREAETGLADQMGVAEMGMNVYTKSWPIRVENLAQTYIRRVGWRYCA